MASRLDDDKDRLQLALGVLAQNPIQFGVNRFDGRVRGPQVNNPRIQASDKHKFPIVSVARDDDPAVITGMAEDLCIGSLRKAPFASSGDVVALRPQVARRYCVNVLVQQEFQAART
jgi:hypothetical protein